MNYGQHILSSASVLETHQSISVDHVSSAGDFLSLLMKRNRAPIPVEIEGEDCFLIPLTKGKFATISAVDLPKIEGFNWHFRIDGYAARTVYGTHKTLRMHRVIAATPAHLETDHKNRNRLDNRRGNLRIATRGNNVCNKGYRYHNQKKASNFRGVIRRLKDGLWVAQIGLNYTNHFLGAYRSQISAAKAYDRAAKKFHGEFATLNFYGSTK